MCFHDGNYWLFLIHPATCVGVVMRDRLRMILNLYRSAIFSDNSTGNTKFSNIHFQVVVIITMGIESGGGFEPD